VADLGAEGNAEFDAGGEERVVAAVGRRSLPQPGNDAKALEAEVGDGAAKLAHGVYRLAEVDRGEAGEAVGMGRDPAGDLIVRDEGSLGTVPGAQEAEVDIRRVHRGNREVDRRLLVGRLHPGPAPQRLEHVVAQEAHGRMLHPDVDRHEGRKCRWFWAGIR
jgi:hypothetical protein